MDVAAHSHKVHVRNVEPVQLIAVYNFIASFLAERIVEIIVSIVCGVAVIGVCAVKRMRKLRSYEEIRTLHVRSTSRRKASVLDVH
jgi:hypothetical protein